MMNYKIDNFTAILPVTCNANCLFCPEKESEKIKKDLYIKNLIKTINETAYLGYDHVSISGGEPSLDCRLLKSVITAILEETPIKKIGITTNGQFLESMSKVTNFYNAIFNEGECLIDFLNISRHSVRNDINNDIMQVNYKHTLADIISFRTLLPKRLSFHLNMVLTEDSNTDELFHDIKIINKVLSSNNIDIALRTDYEWQKKAEPGNLIPKSLFEKYINEFGEATQISGCPTCCTFKSTNQDYSNVYLKAANFEPTNFDDTAREIVFHMNGKAYFDWKREKPFIITKSAEELLGEETLNLLFSKPSESTESTENTENTENTEIDIDSTFDIAFDEIYQEKRKETNPHTHTVLAACGYGNSSCGYGYNSYTSCGFHGC